MAVVRDAIEVGSDGRGDCRVRVSGANTLELVVACGNPPLLAAGIERVVRRAAEATGARVRVEVEDRGALDYVLVARVEAAVRAAVTDAVSIPTAVDRSPSMRDRARRSRLYAPGNNPRLLLGIEQHGADCVLLDLEDAVPPAEKAAARILVKHLLASVAFPAEVWVRINPLDVGGEEDLDEVVGSRPHGICLPKAASPEDVLRASARLAQSEAAAGVPQGSIWLMPIVETAAGVLRCDEVAAADPRVVSLAFGAEDYLRDTGAKRSADALLWPRARLVAAARAAGCQASDTVFADIEDDAGLAREAEAAYGLGFDGKGAIHPRQLPILHRAFTPTAEELSRAERIVAAAEEAEQRGVGAVTVDGRMIDRPVLARARRTLRLAEGERKGGAGC